MAKGKKLPAKARKQKPTAEQIAYAKARAGGQNPMKFRKKDVDFVKKAAVAGLYLAGPGKVKAGAKATTTAAKKTAQAVKTTAKARAAARANKKAQLPRTPDVISINGSIKLERTLRGKAYRDPISDVLKPVARANKEKTQIWFKKSNGRGPLPKRKNIK